MRIKRETQRQEASALFHFRTALAFVIVGLEAFAAGFFRLWHPHREMITGAVLALLGLDGLIVHVHVILDGRHILMSQQFLEAKGVIASTR